MKEEFRLEPYIKLADDSQMRYTSWLRTSSHKLRVEVGRHGTNNSSPHLRTCPFCCTKDQLTLELLSLLPCCELLTENEMNFLKDCINYSVLRTELSEDISDMILLGRFQGLFNKPSLFKTLTYIKKLFNKRSPFTTSLCYTLYRHCIV